MTNAIPLDPDLPRQRRTIRSGIVYSGLSITLVLFALGELPAVDAFFASVNTLLRAHNNQIVSAITHTVPFAVVGLGSFSVVYRVLGFLNRTSRAS